MDNALDAGIKEAEFWEMTLAEIERAIKSKLRVMRAEMREKATYDYILADLIGRSVARVQNSANKMPDIDTVYPSLFDSEEIEEQKRKRRDELTALRFRQFAQAFNKNFKQEVASKE